MTTRFKILFMVDLLHDYFANQQCKDLEVVASEATGRLLKDRQMMYKVVGNKLVVLIKVKSDIGPDENKPFVDIDPKDKFIFYLHPATTSFVTITNLDEDKLGVGQRYYFSNLHQNKLDGELSLTQKLEPIVGAATYKPGDLTADAAGTVYECIGNTTQANNPPNAAFWHDRGKQQYVSQRDMLPVIRKIEEFIILPKAKTFSIKAFALDLTTNQYTREIVLKENVFTSDTDTDRVQVNLAELPPARYKLKINAKEFDLFVDDQVVFNNVLGIVEVFSHFANGTDFAFLDINGKVKDTGTGPTLNWLHYKIKFANRLAYWKYNTPKHGVVAIDGGAAHTFTPTPGGPLINYFLSSKPIPLLEAPWKFKVNVQVLATTEDPLAPNPNPNQPGMLSRTEPEKDYYCTINLNY